MHTTEEIIKGRNKSKFGYPKAGYGQFELSRVITEEQSKQYVDFIVMFKRQLFRDLLSNSEIRG